MFLSIISLLVFGQKGNEKTHSQEEHNYKDNYKLYYNDSKWAASNGRGVLGCVF